MNWKRCSLLMICFSVALALIAQSEYPALKDFLSAKVLEGAQISIYAEDVNSGKTLCAFNEQAALIPASNVKLFSTALAWSALGPGHQFQTHFYWDGSISSNNVLEGNLYIEGEGDPTLGSDKWENRNIYQNFQQIGLKLKAKGIDIINGDIIVSSYPFDGIWHHGDWPWSDIGNYYGISSGSLNFNENFYKLTFNTSGAVGSPAYIMQVEPRVPLSVQNQVIIGPPNSGDRAYIYGDANDSNRVVRGTVPKNGSSFTIKGSLPDPEFFFAQELQRVLLENGVMVSGKVNIDRTLPLTKDSIIHTILSPPLLEVIKYVNKNSHNLFAEAIYRSMIYKHEQKREDKLDAWELTGLDIDGFRWKDGCGLSPFNRFSADDFVDILKIMSAEKAYVNTLAMPGEEGTLRFRFLKWKERLKAKTGSIEGVYALSGWLDLNDSNIAFSILVNNFYGSTRMLDLEVQKLFEGWERQ